MNENKLYDTVLRMFFENYRELDFKIKILFSIPLNFRLRRVSDCIKL